MGANRLLHRKCVCVYMHLAYYSVCTSVPIGDNVLEADKQLSIHVQFVDCGVDGISTWSVTMESVSVGNS